MLGAKNYVMTPTYIPLVFSKSSFDFKQALLKRILNYLPKSS
jgi:hypothetical protein